VVGVQDEFADPEAGQRPTGDGTGSSDDDRQPDDAGANGTLGDAGERRPIPERVTGSPRELLDLDPSRGKRAKRPRPKPPEPPR
jgi:hypothetical protein